MNNSTKFFIVIPVYKSEEYISACLDSVLCQSYSKFAIIAVNDGTPDNAGKICDEYAKKDDRISVIHKENGGQISARTAGIAFAKKQATEQDYFLFLDSDDTLTEDALETINYMILKDNSDIVFFRFNKVFNGVVLKDYYKENVNVGIVDNKRDLYKIVFSNSMYNSMCIKSIRCHIVPEIDYAEYHHLRFAEDLLQSIEIYKNCMRATFSEKRLYNYTTNPNSVTQSVNYKNYKVDTTVRRRVLDFIREEKAFSPADENEYLCYCKTILESEIKRIVLFDAKYKDKVRLLDEVKNDQYYNMLLKRFACDSFIFNDMLHGRYWLFITMLQIRKMLGRLYRKTRCLIKKNKGIEPYC